MTFLDKGNMKETLAGRSDNALRSVRAKREADEAGKLCSCFWRDAHVIHFVADKEYRKGVHWLETLRLRRVKILESGYHVGAFRLRRMFMYSFVRFTEFGIVHARRIVCAQICTANLHGHAPVLFFCSSSFYPITDYTASQCHRNFSSPNVFPHSPVHRSHKP